MTLVALHIFAFACLVLIQAFKRDKLPNLNLSNIPIHQGNIKSSNSHRIVSLAADSASLEHHEKILHVVEPQGFCQGVARAITTLEEALRIFGPPIYVKHEIVHNQHVFAQSRGAIFVEDLENVPEGSVVVFSAHGVSPAVKQLARARNLNVIDATCPLVNKVHVYVSQKAKEGYKIILVGHCNHVETIGTFGEAPDACTIVENVQQVEKLQFDPNDKIFVTTQTTLSVDDYKDILDAIKSKFPQAETIPSGSICYATTNRQAALAKVCPLVEFVLVVGSAASSNANRLVDVAKHRNVPSILVSDSNDVTMELLGDAKRIAITASASTPAHVTSGVITKLTSPPFNYKPVKFQAMQERIPNWRLPRNLEIAIKQKQHDELNITDA